MMIPVAGQLGDMRNVAQGGDIILNPRTGETILCHGGINEWLRQASIKYYLGPKQMIISPEMADLVNCWGDPKVMIGTWRGEER